MTNRDRARHLDRESQRRKRWRLRDESREDAAGPVVLSRSTRRSLLY